MILTGLALGLALGFIFQRGRFCVTGVMRDVWLSRSIRWLTAFLLAIAVQAVLVQILIGGKWISPSIPKLAVGGVVLGSFVFGVGIVLAGGCAAGTYYRTGEGLIGSWIALALYAFTSAVFKYGILSGFNTAVRDQTTSLTTIPKTLGVSPWVLIVVLCAITGYLLWRQAQKTTAPLATLPPAKSGLAHILFEKKWSPNVTAILVGILAAVAYPLSQATGRNSGLGITTPSANVVEFLSTGNTKLIDWGVLFVLGLIPGSYIAAKASGEFRLRVPDVRTAIRAVWGGILMGVGASTAAGCTIGNSLVQTALFSWQGWLAFLFTFLGVGAAAAVFLVPRRFATRVTETTATLASGAPSPVLTPIG